MPKRQGTILIVDDDRGSRNSYALLARAAGFKVEPVLGPVRGVPQLLEVAKTTQAMAAR